MTWLSIPTVICGSRTWGNRRIVKYSPDLEVLTTLDGPEYGWRGPRYLDVDVVGRLIVAD